MLTDGTHDRLDDRLEARLERLAALHQAGELDDAEYRAAKGVLLTAPHAVTAGGSTSDLTATVRTLGPYKWTTWFLIAFCVGFMVACLSSAITPLQRPAAPIVCSNGQYVSGNVSERYGGTTSYNIDASCVHADGVAHHVNQIAIIGVLWFEYTLGLSIFFAIAVWLVRGLRGPPRVDPHP